MDVLFLATVFFFLLPGSVFAAAFYGKRIEFTLAPYLMLNGLVLFFFGCVGSLRFGLYVLLILAGVLWFVTIVRLWKTRQFRPFLDHFATPGLLFFILATILFHHITYWIQFSAWDEFTHWGRVIRIMTGTDLLLSPLAARLPHANYPPGLTLIEYLFMNLLGRYKEGVAVFANNLFVVSLLTIVFARSKWKDVLFNALCGISMLLLPLMFVSAYRYLLVDYALALLFGYTLVQALLLADDKRFRFLVLMTTLPYLFLVKQSGLGLAMLVLLFLLIEYAIQFKSFLKSPRPLLAFLKNAVPLLVLLAAPLAVKLTWTHLLALRQVEGRFMSPDWSLHKLHQGLAYNIPDHFGPILDKCIQAFLCNPINANWEVKLSHFTFMLAAGFLLFWLAITNRDEGTRRRLHLLNGLMAGGYLVYLFTLFIYYVYSDFSKIEAHKLADFPRYMGVYAMAWLFALLAVAVALRNQAGKIRALAVALLMIPVMTVPVCNYPNLASLLRPRQFAHLDSYRAPYELARQMCESYFTPGTRYSVLEQTDVPGHYFSGVGLQYEIELKGCHYKWLTRRLKDPSPTPEQWREACADIDFLYVRTTNDYLKTRFAENFVGGADAIKSDRLYRVNPDRRLELLPIKQFVLDFETINLLHARNLQRATVSKSAARSAAGLHSMNIALLDHGLAVFDLSALPQLGRFRGGSVSFSLHGDGKQAVCSWNLKKEPFWSQTCDWKGWKSFTLEIPSGALAEKVTFTVQASNHKANLFLDNLVLSPENADVP